MAVPAAYIALIIVWSTTPLALKWSTEEVGFLFAAAGRMSLGLLCVVIVARLRGEVFGYDWPAFKVYGAAAVGIFGAMFCVYWGAQFIPSGWIAIVFGSSPLITTLLARLMLGERSLSTSKLIGLACGLAGLGVIFYSGMAVSVSAALGILAVVVSTCLHSLSAVLIKRLNSDLPALIIVGGGLALSLVPYYLCWFLIDGQWPQAIPNRSLGGILYLGTIATTVGFTLYFFVLKHQTPTQVALIAFISPISALILGNLLNGEAFDARVLLGAALVLVALFLHEVFPAWRKSSKQRASAVPIAPPSS